MSEFLPVDYEIPTTPSDFTKFEEETTTKIRILPSWLDYNCFIYYEYFQDYTDENWEIKQRPIRSKIKPTEVININSKSQVEEKWSFKVYNYNTQNIQICSIRQKWIKQAIRDYSKNEDYWDVLWYDFKISRTGKALLTKYWVVASPPKEFNYKLIEWTDKKIDWIAFLESSKDVFLTN